jgi:hypothetical protein
MIQHRLWLLMMTMVKILCHCLSYINKKKKDLFFKFILADNIMMLQENFIILLLIILSIGNIQGQFRRLLYPKGEQSRLGLNDDPGEPLFLTPYIEQGKIEEARQLRYNIFLLCFVM